jgi:hypothetical protein
MPVRPKRTTDSRSILEFIKDKLLGPLIVVAVIAISGAITANFDKRFLIHMLGGVADGEAIMCQSFAPSR